MNWLTIMLLRKIGHVYVKSWVSSIVICVYTISLSGIRFFLLILSVIEEQWISAIGNRYLRGETSASFGNRIIFFTWIHHCNRNRWGDLKFIWFFKRNMVVEIILNGIINWWGIVWERIFIVIQFQYSV